MKGLPRQKTQIEISEDRRKRVARIVPIVSTLVLLAVAVWQAIRVAVLTMTADVPPIVVDPSLPYSSEEVGAQIFGGDLFYQEHPISTTICIVAAVVVFLVSLTDRIELPMFIQVLICFIAALTAVSGLWLATAHPKADDSATFSTWVEQRYGIEISDGITPGGMGTLILDDGNEVSVDLVTDTDGRTGYILRPADKEAELPTIVGE